ncbi:MAG: efflux RND transporter periplasmic adaptor subunit [Planctomycetes bacterium]|nr:efflux RND transporter periplasmic adaptor subunit [Planctomycetota bacterium]
MKTIVKLLIGLGILAGIGYASYGPLMNYMEQRNKTQWRTQGVEQGEIIQAVNSTGKVEPIKRVSVGATVSGPIAELLVDFNTKVTKDQVLARIDPRLYQSAVERDQANLRTRQAEVARADAMLQQARNDERRSGQLNRSQDGFISEAEIDQFRFARMMREAELQVAQTNVEQSQAQLDNSQANLAYTEILAPCDGIIIDKKIDVGQTLAAQFQTPEMFVVAPEMDQRMHIYASVDEADIGWISKAMETGQLVRFTVDAYPDELFDQGKIVQVRLSSKEEQNVITYPVIVQTPNQGMKLLPGMTANLSFQINRKSNILKVPNPALRFYPNREKVHPDDRKILDGFEDQKEFADSPKTVSADEKADNSRALSFRHVWVDDGKFLRAKKVKIGISDNRYTELIEGELKPGEELVIGEKIKK